MGVIQTHPTKLAEKGRESKLATASSRNYDSINNDSVEESPAGETTSTDTNSPSIRSVLVPPIVISLTTHAFRAVTVESFRTLLPLMLSTSIPLGGLALSSARIGTIMAIWGFCNGGFQLVFSARVIRKFGPKKTFVMSYGSYAICFALYPAMSHFAQRANGVDTSVICVLVVQLSCSILAAMSYGKLSPIRHDRRISLIDAQVPINFSLLPLYQIRTPLQRSTDWPKWSARS